MKEECGWQNGMKLSLLTSQASVCNTTMVGFESGDTVERMLNSCVMHRHSGLAPGIRGLATAIFQKDNAPHVVRTVPRVFVHHQIELLPWLARSPDLTPIENTWSMVAQRLTQITLPAATPDQLWHRVEAAWSTVPQEHIQSLFELMPRRVAAVIPNNGGYWLLILAGTPHFTEVYKFNNLILRQHVIYKINFVMLSLVFLGVAFTVASCCIYGGQQCTM
ncbi:transposable element Tcb1 transposase [Trichonephila clavipes]|nr:transposable element Tcb1 transposase [Trichonephila clavipes]